MKVTAFVLVVTAWVLLFRGDVIGFTAFIAWAAALQSRAELEQHISEEHRR